MDSPNDTIAAIATAPGESAISIVRVSGPRSLEVADRIVQCREPPPSKRPANTFVRGFVHSASGQCGSSILAHVDEVILLIYRAPHSYTREDVAEIQCHGGPVSARRILEAVIRGGARLAEPGEFTKRAFLNGRIDLLQAEAVMDLIRAQSDRAAMIAVEQLEGRLSRKVNSLYDDVIKVAARLEASLDFPEEEELGSAIAEAGSKLSVAAEQLQALIGTWNEGHILRDGALVVISGRTNVGKSTLLNCLLCADRAIVSHMPGTTRDTIEETLVLEGIPIRLVDTAGLRDTECCVEQMGIRKAENYMSRADLHLHVVDASVPISDGDHHLIKSLDPAKCILVLNKCDLGFELAKEEFEAVTVRCTLTRNEGLDEVRKAILGRLRQAGPIPPHAAISERHRQLLLSALDRIQTTVENLQRNEEDRVVLAATELRAALEAIGLITGRVYHDQLLDSIFSRFCVGK